MRKATDLKLLGNILGRIPTARLGIFGLLALIWPTTAWSRPYPSQTEKCITPLMRAIRFRNLDGIQRLVKSGVDLDEKACPEGNTALFEAIGGGQPQVAVELILAGADPSLTDNDRLTPLMAAAWNCHLDVATLLLERKANVNASNSNGDTALMNAAQSCDDGKMVALLLRAGASVNSRDKKGDTALTTAAFYGNELAVIELVAAGADVNAKTVAGETALTIAKARAVGRKPSHDRISMFLQTFSSSQSTDR